MTGTSFYEGQMRMAFDSIPCGLCIYQIEDGQILPRFCNPAFHEILGCSDALRSDAGQVLDLKRGPSRGCRAAEGKTVRPDSRQRQALPYLPSV